MGLQIARGSPGSQLGLNPVCVEFWFEPSVFILGAGATLNMNFTEDCKRAQWKYTMSQRPTLKMVTCTHFPLAKEKHMAKPNISEIRQ